MNLPQEAPAPSWVTTEAELTDGLDLLGLRVPVERIGQPLLDGITTISPTVRYVALRAWIARRYALARLPDSWTSFRQFAATIEAAVAIGNLLVDEKTAGLVGRDGAAEIIPTKADPLELKSLVKQLAISAYAGPSDQLGVSFPRESGVSGLTEERGLPLAEAVEEEIGRTSFARALASQPTLSVFSRQALRELGSAYPIGNPSSKEREVLIECLVPLRPRDGELGRVATYAFLLELARRHRQRIEEFHLFQLAIATNPSLPGDHQPWLDGWLRYLLRDTLAVTHEAVLAAALAELAAMGGTGHPQTVLRGLLAHEKELEEPLKVLKILPKGKKPLDQPVAQLMQVLRALTQPRTPTSPQRWDGALHEENLIRLALDGGPGSLSLLVVAWFLVAERSATLAENYKEQLSYQGVWRVGLNQVVLPVIEDVLRRNPTIREAAYDLARLTVYQHLSVAWARLAGDPRRDVALLSSDGEIWRSRKSFRQNRTASRLPQAIGWLRQLRLIGDAGCTPDGDQTLSRASSILREKQSNREP